MSSKSSPSLTLKSDLQLVRMVKRNASDEAFLEICRRHEKLFYSICQKYAVSLASSGVPCQDILLEKNIIIYNCILSFDPKKKVKLSSWIGNYARYLCLNSINARKFILQPKDDEDNTKAQEDRSYQQYLENPPSLKEDKDYIFYILDRLKDKRIKEIFEYRYFSPTKMIWDNIAKKINTSPQTVITLHKKGLSLIKTKMRSCENICDLV